YLLVALVSLMAWESVQHGLRYILAPGTVVALDADGTLTFYRASDPAATPVKMSQFPRQKVPLGAGDFSYRISDEEARINVNTATPDRIASLLSSVGLDKQARDVVGDSLQDWKDPDDLHRANGAESEDGELKQ